MQTSKFASTQINVSRYSSSSALTWNRWNDTARNGHFMFNRNYMDYHQDRFVDHSLLFFVEEQLTAILPACEKDGTLISHGGLTFGSLIVQESMRTPLMLRIFESLIKYLHASSFAKLRYKAIPYIYHSTPGEDDLYALFRQEARLVRRDASSTIRMDHRLAYSKGRKYSLKLAQKQQLSVQESSDFSAFMALEEEILSSKYKTRPAHSHEEIALLADRFPENIKLHAVLKNDELIAGIIMYDSNWVSHAQYMAATEEAKSMGALDLIVDTLLTNNKKSYFDFGISTEHDGQYLNEGLIAQKEMFGARTVLYDTYEVDISARS